MHNLLRLHDLADECQRGAHDRLLYQDSVTRGRYGEHTPDSADSTAVSLKTKIPG